MPSPDFLCAWSESHSTWPACETNAMTSYNCKATSASLAKPLLMFWALAVFSLLLISACGRASEQSDSDTRNDLLLDAPNFWEPRRPVPDITINGVTLAGKNLIFASGRAIHYEFWLLTEDPNLLQSSLRPIGVSLHSKDTELELTGAGAILVGGGIHMGSASFGPYDYANSHPNIPGRNKELIFSIQSLEVLNPDGSVESTISGPWRTVVAERTDLHGSNNSTLYTYSVGEWTKSQFGVTVKLADGLSSIGVVPYEVVRKGSPPEPFILGLRNDGPYVVNLQDYEKAAEEYASKPKYGLFAPGQEPIRPLPPGGGQQPLQGGGGTATVQVGSALLTQGQQAQIFVKVKSITDPDGLGGYDFKITWDPTVIDVLSVGGGDGPFSGSPTQNIDNVSGVVKFNAIQSSLLGPTADTIVDYLTVKAIGPVLSDTNLVITVTSLVEAAEGALITVTTQNGYIAILP